METTVDHKTAKKTSLEEVLVSTRKALSDTDKELEAANAYFEKLKSKCITVDRSDRNERREQEIQSLKDAYEMLASA